MSKWFLLNQAAFTKVDGVWVSIRKHMDVQASMIALDKNADTSLLE